jgi:hypothetical protein
MAPEPPVEVKVLAYWWCFDCFMGGAVVDDGPVRPESA